MSLSSGSGSIWHDSGRKILRFILSKKVTTLDCFLESSPDMTKSGLNWNQICLIPCKLVRGVIWVDKFLSLSQHPVYFSSRSPDSTAAAQMIWGHSIFIRNVTYSLPLIQLKQILTCATPQMMDSRKYPLYVPMSLDHNSTVTPKMETKTERCCPESWNETTKCRTQSEIITISADVLACDWLILACASLIMLIKEKPGSGI